MAIVKSNVWVDVLTVLHYEIEHDENATGEEVVEIMNEKIENLDVHMLDVLRNDERMSKLVNDVEIGEISILGEDEC